MSTAAAGSPSTIGEMVCALRKMTETDDSIPSRLGALLELGPSESKDEAVARLASL